jgi:hypothetical protein
MRLKTLVVLLLGVIALCFVCYAVLKSRLDKKYILFVVNAKNNNYCMDNVKGEAVYFTVCDGSDSQRWQQVGNKDGSVLFRSFLDKKYLNSSNNSVLTTSNKNQVKSFEVN